MEQYNSVQQLLKKEEGHKDRKPVFPSTVIQAVFDGKTGASLEAILAQFNSIYIQYQGSPEATRNIIPVEMRRAGLTITYMNMDSETITERASSAVQKDNDHWGLNINWTRVDELSLSGDIAVSANGTWIINGEDTGVKAVGPKGDAGITPWLKTIDNKLHFSYDNVNWEPCSENIAAWFKFKATSSTGLEPSVGKFQISRDNKNWEDLSPEITNALRIAGYVATSSALPSGKPVGTIFGVGPTFAAEDTAHTNPIYRLYVYDGSKWVDNGTFTSIAAGVAQETGDSETLVMSQKATTAKLSELGKYVENPEYARAYTDAEGRFLWGIKQDGSIEWAKGVPQPIKNYIASVDLKNDEEVERINQLVIDLLADVKVLTDTYHYVSNPEWACAIVDSEERILMGIKADGRYYIPNRDMYHVESNPEWLQVTTDSEGRVLEGIGFDGKKYLPKQELFEKYNDVEGRTEMTLDAEGRIMSYRDAKGVKYENKQHIGTASFDNLNLTHKNVEEIAKSLESVGFKAEFPMDFSKNEFVELPIPRVAAIVKLYVSKIPTTKTDDIEGYLEYSDKDGNYFKKSIILNAQGSSSMGYYVKNMAVDFNDDSKIKFGHWVDQDSFHIKKYYIDAFRGQCVVGYHLMEQVYQTRPFGQKKPFDYLNANDSIYEGIGKIKKDFNTGALCHPDGFPVVIYHVKDGVESYMGVYAWCLKKHRDNYYADKSKSNNIILDGVINDTNVFGANGNVSWSSFEIRNPKNLIDIDGEEYDGENPKELSNADALSLEVKGYIERLSMVKSALDGNRTKEVFEQYFLVNPFIDWFLVSQITYNIDGFSKNWIWCTWDGIHWTPTLYDVDSIFGSYPTGTFIYPNSETGILQGSIAAYIKDIYSAEIKERYIELREKRIFDVDNIVKLLTDWLDRIGYQNLKDDLELYNETPSYRKSYLNEGWLAVNYYWEGEENDFDATKIYNAGETCVYENYQFKALNQITGVPPLSKTYGKNPNAMGYYNSPSRVKNWLTRRMSYLDSVYNYNV